MTTARKDLVDVDVTRWYHCISKCTRACHLLNGGPDDRKRWIEERLQMLDQAFAIAVGGFSVMDNHLHLLIRLDPEEAVQWSDQEVIRRWIAVYPPSQLATDDPKVVKKWVDHKAQDKKHVKTIRQRLQNLGWFMKSLKEPLARLANGQDGCKGSFWEPRYKSIAILDTEALLATSAYIDLNPVAAGIAEVPEKSEYTSIHQRVAHVREQGKLDCLKAARAGSVAGSRAAGNIEQGHWLVPIEDRRIGSRTAREGMLETFSLGSYLLLVDYTGRLHRNGKARVGSAVEEVFERLGTSQDYWCQRIGKMLSSESLRGSYFATRSETIRELSERRGKRTANLTPQVPD